MSVEYVALIRSLLGLDDTAECKSADGDGFRRPIGPEKHIVAEAMSSYLDGEITNKDLKHAVSHFCSEEENIDLENWFPDEEDEKNEEKEITHDEELKHGAKRKYKRKQCSKEGCTKKSRKGGVCVKHGAKYKLCSKEGCTKQAKKGGVCIRHGAKLKKRHKKTPTSKKAKGKGRKRKSQDTDEDYTPSVPEDVEIAVREVRATTKRARMN